MVRSPAQFFLVCGRNAKLSIECGHFEGTIILCKQERYVGYIESDLSEEYSGWGGKHFENRTGLGVFNSWM